MHGSPDPALQSPVMQEEDNGTDLANEFMSPRSDGEGEFAREQRRFLDKGKGRADSTDEAEVDEEAEAKAVQLHLKAMAKAEQERRKTIRKQTTNMNAPPSVNLHVAATVSDLSRRGSAALSRAASKRSSRSTKGHQQMTSFSSTDAEPLPTKRGSFHPSEEGAYELSQFSPPPTPLRINTQHGSTSSTIESPISYQTSPTHTESTITSPVSPSATERAIKTGSRFVEDLESQNMSGREINLGNRSRSSTGQSTIRPTHAKKSSSTSSFNLFQPLTQSTYDLHRPMSRQSANSGRPSMANSASFFSSDSARLLDEGKRGKRYKYDVTAYESDEEEEEEVGGKQSWFEWFCCGCCAEERDGEQGGRTNPME